MANPQPKFNEQVQQNTGMVVLGILRVKGIPKVRSFDITSPRFPHLQHQLVLRSTQHHKALPALTRNHPARRSCKRGCGRARKITYLHNALGQRVCKSESKVDHVTLNASALGMPFGLSGHPTAQLELGQVRLRARNTHITRDMNFGSNRV